MKRRWIVLVFLGCWSAVTQVSAGHTLMVRTAHSFETAMGILQQTLEEYGYSVAHVQRCDGGMADFGYKSDFYRVVFFGKIDEVRDLSDKYPELIPYLPLKILELAELFEPGDLRIQFKRWHSDVTSILQEVRTSRPALPPQ